MLSFMKRLLKSNKTDDVVFCGEVWIRPPTERIKNEELSYLRNFIRGVIWNDNPSFFIYGSQDRHYADTLEFIKHGGEKRKFLLVNWCTSYNARLTTQYIVESLAWWGIKTEIKYK